MISDPGAFYHGAYADALVASVADGGALSQEDLDAYRVIERVPRSVPVDGYTVHARGDDLDDVLGTLQAAAAGVTGDPHRPRGGPDADRSPARAGPRAETTNLVAVDDQGDGCVITTSLGLGLGRLGARLRGAPELHDRRGRTGRGPARPGCDGLDDVAPGRARRTGALAAAAGAAGGSRIRPALVQTLLRVLRGAAPQQAVDAARLNALPDLVRLEPGFDAHVLRGLEAAGVPTAVAAGLDPYFGGVSAISGSAGARTRGAAATSGRYPASASLRRSRRSDPPPSLPRTTESVSCASGRPGEAPGRRGRARPPALRSSL